MLSIILFPLKTLAQFSVENVQFPYPLEQEKVDFISQSKDGIYWFGGVNGLIRFDGIEARRIIIRDKNKQHISHDQNVQSSMLEDKDGKLWFSTVSAFHCFDPVSEIFTTHQIKVDGYFVREDYRHFYIDKTTGELWLQAGDQIWRWHLKTGDCKKLAGPTSAVHFNVCTDTVKGTHEIYGSRWMRAGIEHYKIDNNRKFTTPNILASELKSIRTFSLGKDSLLVGARNGLFLTSRTNNTYTKPRTLANNIKGSISNIIIGP